LPRGCAKPRYISREINKLFASRLCKIEKDFFCLNTRKNACNSQLSSRPQTYRERVRVGISKVHMIQDGLRIVRSQNYEPIWSKKSVRFENVCARSAAHLTRTTSSAAKAAKTDGPSRRSGPGAATSRRPAPSVDDVCRSIEPRHCRQHGRVGTAVLGHVHQYTPPLPGNVAKGPNVAKPLGSSGCLPVWVTCGSRGGVESAL
jgi:hypothetical protein